MNEERTVQKINVSLGRGVGNRRALVPQETDVFKAKGEDLRKFTNLSDAMRKRIYRAVQKDMGGTDDSGYHGANGSKSKALDPMQSISIDAYNIFGAVIPPYNIDYLAKLFEMSPPHYAAVRAKVANIVGLGYDFSISPKANKKLSQTQSDRTKKSIQQAVDNERQAFLDWLDECNDQDEFLETMQKVWTDYETTGNGYFEIGRGLDGKVAYIGHIPSQTMRVRIHRDGYVQAVANKVVFFRNFGDKNTVDPLCGDPMPNEVIHIKKYSPTNTFYGVPDIIAAQQAIAGNEFSARFNLDYFENKAVPRYVIVLKGANFSSTAEQNLLEFFETGLKGQNHRTLFVPLPANDEQQQVDFEMHPVEAGTQDASFVQYRRGNLEEILMAHRVPISKVTMPDGMQLATARDADKTFKEQVCRPEQDMLEKKFNKVIKELSDIVVFKLNELTLTDEDQQSQIDQRELQSGITVPNEVRARKGMPPREGGDHPMVLSAQDQKDQQQAQLDAQKEQTAAQIKAQAANAKIQAETARHQATQQARVGVAQAKHGTTPAAPGAPAAPAAKKPANPANKPAQQRADRASNARQSDTRAQQRSANRTDSRGEGRNAKGDGPKAP